MDGRKLFAVAIVVASAVFVSYRLGVLESGPVEPGTPVAPWPPVRGEAYPDIDLRDVDGRPFRLSQLRGRPILVEIAATSCAGCIAFSGGNRAGGFDGAPPQAGLESIDEILRGFAGVALGDSRFEFVQILCFDLSARNPPSVEEGKRWARHFGLDGRPNVRVLVGDARYVGPATHGMVPGFHLIDRDFKLRSISAGHHPEDDLYRALMPMLRSML